jgi:uncharacterized membrane protein YedE/YeeE
MPETIFADPGTLALGAVTGLIFGFLLQRGGATRFDTIVGQFLLRDFTMLKIMLTAMIVGGVGIYGMQTAGFDVALHVKTALLLANTLGGVLFGVGMVVLGYCPGTGVAALGEGAKDALFGVFGMLAGAALYAEVYPWMKVHVLGVGDLGKTTLAESLGVSPWVLLAVIALGGVAAMRGMTRREAQIVRRQSEVPA